MKGKKRALYFAIFLGILIAECLIGAFVRTPFVRFYVGDMLVTVLLCAIGRTILLEKTKHLPLWVFLIGVVAEFLQLFSIADRLGITDPILRIALGSTFDMADIVCYGIGCTLFFGIERLVNKTKFFIERV